MFDGELTHVNDICFRDSDKLDIVGINLDYERAHFALRAAAHRMMDSAVTRYFIVHLQKLMRPYRLHMQSALVHIKCRLFDRLGQRRMGMAGARNIFCAS